MQEQIQLSQNEEESLPDQLYFPTQPYQRENFYKTFKNVRYMLKVNLTNGQQAEDVPVTIEKLIDFLGDIEHEIDRTDGISVEYRNHDSWTAKIHTGCDYRMNSFDWEDLESRIEQLATEHGIALRKTVSMSGRGYSDPGRRLVSVAYTFGTYDEDGGQRMIDCEDNPRSKVSWVGGELGTREQLNESTIEIKSVERVDKSGIGILNYLKSLFGVSS